MSKSPDRALRAVVAWLTDANAAIVDRLANGLSYLGRKAWGVAAAAALVFLGYAYLVPHKRAPSIEVSVAAPANMAAPFTNPSQIKFNQNVTGSTSRSLAAKLSDNVSVKDFGAVGDGVTDDSTAVTNAINASGPNQAIDFACPGNYKTTLYGTLACGDYYPPVSGATGSVPRSLPQKILDIVDVKDFGAKGDGTTDDTASIQAAINAVQGATLKGSILLFPSGTYKICTGLPLTISGSIDVRGQGWNQTALGPTTGTVIQPCSTVPGTIDEFLIQPTGSSTITVRFSNFAVVAPAGNPGRYVFHLDGTNGTIVDSSWEKLYIAVSLGSRAFYGEGDAGNGTPVSSWISDCVINGGIQFTTGGDSNRIMRNRFASSATGNAIDATFIAGASSFTLVHNYFLLTLGGIHFGAFTIAPMIAYNEIQTQTGFTGSNGAVVDFDGTVGSHAVDVMIGNNSFQVVNAITANEIRVNFADRTHIWNNRFGRGATTSKDILVTANASDTYIEPNSWVSGGPYTSMVSDSGTRTTFFGPFPGSSTWVVPANQGIGSLDDAGTARTVLVTSGSDGSVQLNGYHGTAALIGVNGETRFYDSNGNLGITVGSTVSTVPTASAIATVAKLAAKFGISADGGGLKHIRTTAGCATAASVGAACDTTVTWGTAFADANYTPECMGFGITSGVPVHGGIVSKVAASTVFRTVAMTAVAAQYTNIYCFVPHD